MITVCMMRYKLLLLLISLVVILFLISLIWFDLGIILTDDLKNMKLNNLNEAQNKNLDYNKGEIDRQEVEKAIQYKVNQTRLNQKLSTIESDPNLSEVARYKSKNMRKNNYLSHITPQGNSPLDILNMYNVDYCEKVGENILKTKYKSRLKTSFSNNTIFIDSEQRLSEVIFKGWMNSENHRGNIFNKRWEYQSAGISVDKNGTVYATQVFCR